MQPQVTINGPVLEKCPPGCGFDKGRVLSIIAAPDSQHTVTKGEGKFNIFVKQFFMGGKLCVDLVGGSPHSQTGDLVIDLAVRIRPGMFDASLEELSPLGMLEAFVEKFGVEVRVGEEKRKLFREVTVPIQEGATMQEAIAVDFPKKHSVFGTAMIGVRTDPHRLEILMLFAIDTFIYAEWLNNNPTEWR
jgi:hypothetical protein